MKNQKKLLKLADMILSQINSLKTEQLKKLRSDMQELTVRCSDVCRQSGKFEKALDRKWTSSADKIKSSIQRDVTDFSYHLQRFKQLLDTPQGRKVKLSDIYNEFGQIADDIGRMGFDLKAKTISVFTDTIVLEDVNLGSFEIRLSIDDITGMYKQAPYKVIALEPNPAGSNCEVTHPHVSDESLCEGDGFTSIRRALEDGRICDFFMIITNILQTYNPDSPYVSIHEWEGINCYDCGYTISGDESYYCEYCDRDYCSSCSTYCQSCDTTICLGCAYECPSCQMPVCKSCTAVCVDCEEVFCKHCLNEESLCKSCKEDRKDGSHEEQSNSKAGAEVHTHSVGETVISA